MQVDLRSDHVQMSHVRREPRESCLDIDALVIPVSEPMDRKRMTKVVRAGAYAAAAGLEPLPAQESREDPGQRLHFRRLSMAIDEQTRPFLRRSGVFLRLGQIALDLTRQVLTERHDSSSALAF